MEDPTDAEVDVGGTLIFTCRVSGDPKPDVKWMRDSAEVEIDGERYQVREDGTLIISDATENDTGEYECVAHNEMGFSNSRKARALITVSNLIRFTEIPISQTVESGVDVSFVCKAEASSTPIMEWWRNGRQLSSEGRFKLEENGSVLKIEAAKQSDSSRYICRAKNSEGFSETSADLKVLGNDFRSPELTYQPQDMEVEIGASIEIPCRAEGNPTPLIQWKKDGSALASNRDRIRISKWGSLYLHNVSAQDSGRYVYNLKPVNNYGNRFDSDFPV